MKRNRSQMAGFNAVCLLLASCLTVFAPHAASAGDTAPADVHPVPQESGTPSSAGTPASGAPAASKQKSVTTNHPHKHTKKKRRKKRATKRAAHKHASRDFPQPSTNMMDPNHVTTPIGK